MSTDHSIYVKQDEDRGEVFELSVYEHSNKFDICMISEEIGSGGLEEIEMTDLTLDQLKEVAARLNEVISYYE